LNHMSIHHLSNQQHNHSINATSNSASGNSNSTSSNAIRDYEQISCY
jgi:hypothetical protein